MNTRKQVLSAVIALSVLSVSAFAHCGTCGTGDAKKCDAGGCPVAAAKTDAKAQEPTINTAGLAALLAAKTPVAVLDARAGKWDDGKRIPGAKALNAGSTDAEIAAALPDKQSLVVTYCAGLTCSASHKLAEKLHSLGYQNVVEYAEGIAGWQAAGNAVEEAKK